jgi:cellulose synthase/poly-beta-1,6-N-acetylglucosamine synthase-like glycosyltransferase
MTTEMVICFIVCYALFTLLLILGWKQQIRKSQLVDNSGKACNLKVSIIIPCRNEEATIGRLLQRLISMQPHTFIEILCVDDHSTDHTARIIKEVEKVKYISLTEFTKGKKAAIEEGIRRATGDVILVTDADCYPDEYWLESMTIPFLSSQIHMVCGWVRMNGQGTVFSELVSLEFSTMIALSAAMSGWNKPVLCNGASLAFRRESFLQVGGYSGDKAASGDDVFLMHKFKSRFGKHTIHYMIQPGAGVETMAPNTLNTFIQQRIRWAQKSVLYRDFDTIFLSLFILLVHGWLLGWFIVSWFEPHGWIVFSLSWMGKSICDVWWVGTYASALKQEHWNRFVLPLCVIHWLYIPFIALLSQLAPSPQWKGRTWKNG